MVYSENEAIVGSRDTAMAGDDGRAEAGHFGTAFAGRLGQAVAKDYGLAFAGPHGSAMAGDDGVVAIEWFDGSRRRLAVGYVGEDGIQPDTMYVVRDGKLVRSSGT